MKRLTIRWRVTLVAVGVLAIALAVLGVVGNLILTDRLEADANDVLRNRAAASTATLERVGDQVRVRESAGDGALDEQSWVFVGGKTVEASRAEPDVRAAVNSLAAAGSPVFKSVGERVRLFAQPAYADNGDRLGTVVVGVSLNPYERSERIARYGLFVLSIFVLLLAAAAIYWAVGRALAPVDTMTRRASDWSEHDLHRRFELGEPSDEITALAATLDVLLGRIDGAMQREQRVTAEIAHELRTPLASIRAEAELAMRESGGNKNAALTQIVASVDRMNAAIETLLAAHRGDAPAGRSCDPAIATSAAVESFRMSCPDKHWEVESREGDAQVEVDESVLIQTLGPVLDNASRHAKSAVNVLVSRNQQRVLIAVTDDGPGVGDDGADIFSAGVSSGEGAGLGLPLAKRLAQSFGAELVTVPSDIGARFELRMPGRKPA
jgi:signal transduction histidine kinase